MAQQLASNPPDTNGIQVLKGISQAEFLNWLSELNDLDADVAAAVDRRKAKLADIKQRLGKDEFASFKSSRKDAELPGESRERRELSRRKMMAWLNKPLGFQASLDMAPGTDENVVALSTHTLKAVDSEGYAAGKAGHLRESNPYTPGTEAAQRFDTAWLRGQADLAATLKPEDTEPKRRGRPPGTGKKQQAARQTAEAAAQEARERGLVEDKETPDRVH